jgi:hypothetical protein
MKFIGGLVNIFKNMLQNKSLKNSFLWKNQNVQKMPICGWVFCHCWLVWLWSHPKVNFGIIQITILILDKNLYFSSIYIYNCDYIIIIKYIINIFYIINNVHIIWNFNINLIYY